MLYSNTCEYPMIDSCPPRPLIVDGSKWQPKNVEIAPNCPRCASSNTKFCYYNNYSLSQPRYFCKGCRRYWTKGGSLRNVPFGGGCRKSRRAKAAKQVERSGGRVTSGDRNQCVSSGAVDIDLAAVFASYLNQNVENNEEKSGGEESSSPGASYSSSSEIQASCFDVDSQLEDALFEYRKPEYQKPVGPADLVDMSQFQEVLIPPPHLSSIQENVQELMGSNPGDFRVQSMLGDELEPEIWCDGPNLPNFPCQSPIVQFQDFEVFSSDDQFKISPNLENNNWSSFDLSGYEFFSGP